MNSRKILITYLETSSNLNVNKDIYENYKEIFINRKELTTKDKRSTEDFIRDYLYYIYKSLKNTEEDELEFIIQEVIGFLKIRKKVQIFKKKEHLKHLQELLTTLVYHINVSLKSFIDGDVGTNKISSVHVKSHNLLSVLNATVGDFLRYLRSKHRKFHGLESRLLRICEQIQDYKNSKVLQRDLVNNIYYCLTGPSLDESFKKIPYLPYRIESYRHIKESEYLRHLLLIFTRNYQTTFNKISLLLNITDRGYIKKFIRLIIFSLKNNQNTEVTYDYLNTISNFYLKNLAIPSKKFFQDKANEFQDEPSNVECFNKVSLSALEAANKIKKRLEYLDEEKYEQRVYEWDDVICHTICKDFSRDKDSKELFLTLTSNYRGVFSKNTRGILKTIQTHTFQRVYDQISLISNRREREYIRQIFESITRYLENNNSVNIEAVWVVNISIENVSRTNKTRQEFSNRRRYKSFSNMNITLGFSKEIEKMENNELLEFSELKPFYIPIDYRKDHF